MVFKKKSRVYIVNFQNKRTKLRIRKKCELYYTKAILIKSAPTEFRTVNFSLSVSSPQENQSSHLEKIPREEEEDEEEGEGKHRID